MAKQYTNYPPLDNRKTRRRRFLGRAFVNLFILIAIGIGFYFVFSVFFDTPEEYRMRQSTEALRYEYDRLNRRLEEIESVLENVSDRDRNIFHVLFESDPYNFNDGYGSSWTSREELMTKSNRELKDIFEKKQEQVNTHTSEAKKEFNSLYNKIESLGNRNNNIPSVQPIINNELTLLTASFGQRIQPYYKVLTMHAGVDYTVPEGTRVFATADGKIKTATSKAASTGNTIIIDHGNGYETHYNHLGNMFVKQNQSIKRGDIIALTGNTGLSLVPHLHYEVRYNNDPVDPIHYFFAELSPKEYDRMIRIARSGMQSFD